MRRIADRLRWVCFVWLLAAFAVTAGESDGWEAERFLAAAREPRGTVDTYAGMEGTVRHRRAGRSTQEAPIYLAIWFTPNRALAQLIVNDAEGYVIGQSFRSGSEGSSVIPMGEYAEPLLDQFGLRASDLTLSFIYWPFERELASASVRTLDCRVMVLKAPETFNDGKERVKVYFSKEYLYPVKAEWFESPEAVDAGRPLRSLEVNGFRKEGDFWVVSELRLDGEGWRTLVNFEDIQVGKVAPGEQPPVVRTLPRPVQAD